MARKPKGIRRHGAGWEVYWQVNGHLFRQPFDLETPIATMIAFRASQIARWKSERPRLAFSPSEARRSKPAPPDAAIDFSEIPEVSDTALDAMVRSRAARLAYLAQPVLPGRQARIYIRLDSELLEAVRDLARARGVKYQTLVQQLLADAVVRESAVKEQD